MGILERPADATKADPRQLGYVPALDGVRAVAIATVLSFHATGFPAGGGLGVTLFFVLSGFLITTLLLDEQSRLGLVSLRSFYVRRARRLLPGLFALFAVGTVFYTVLALRSGNFDATPFGMVLFGLTYSANIAVATTHGEEVPFGHLWSLATEEQFYLLWPITLVVLLRSRVTLALVVALAGAALVTLQAARLYSEHTSFMRIWYAPDSGSSAVMIGCALALANALWSMPSPRGRVRSSHVLVLTAVATFFVLLLQPMRFFIKPGMPLVAALVCAALVFAALGDNLLARLLALSPVTYLGRISYSVYLWHALALAALGVHVTRYEPLSFAAIALALAISALSYHYVEEPFRRRRGRWIETRERRRLLAAVSAA